MANELSYEQTVELEANVKIKNEAENIYNEFMTNVKLDPRSYKGHNEFVYWRDDHNAIYIAIVNDKFEFRCRFLHENYTVTVTPSGIFDALKSKNRGVDHLRTHSRPLTKSCN